jgi:predicted nucleotidyltransferase
MRIGEAIKKISRKYGIRYAIVFGSYITKTRWKESDIDLAVKLKRTPKDFKENLKVSTKISGELGKMLGKEVDVIILNSASLGLKFEIFETGKVLLCKNMDELVEDKSRTIACYHDFKFFVQPLYDKLVKRYEGRKYS